MPTNRQLDHSFPAVLDIFGKGLNLPAPLDIQWPKCFQLQGGFAPSNPLTRGSAPGPRRGLCPQIPVRGSCSALAMVPPTIDPFRSLWSPGKNPVGAPGRDMVVCNSFDIYMFTLSRTARWCQYLTNSDFLSFFFWGCQKSALIAILKTPSGNVSFNSWLRCYRIV